MTPQEQLSEFAKTVPPVTVASMTAFGYSIADWVLLLTAIYTALQIVLLIRRMMVSRRASDTTCVKQCVNRVRHDQN